MADGTQAQDAVTLHQLEGALTSVATTQTLYFHASSTGTNDDSLAIGANSIAVGPSAVVNADEAIGIGDGATAQMNAPGGIALGEKAGVAEADAIAFGANASASAVEAVAIGSGANATMSGSVALGAGSTTSIGALTNYTAYGLSGTFSSAGEVSVGSAGAPRQITNVAPGKALTDAVNVEQLETVAAGAAAGAQSHYFSVNDGGTQGGNFNNDGAIGANATAIGVGALSSAPDGTAVGESASVTGQYGSAFGYQARAIGLGATAIGGNGTAGASAAASNSIAIGGQAVVQSIAASGIAIGFGATLDDGASLNSLAIGVSAMGSAPDATAVGESASVSGQYGSAVGYEAEAHNSGGVAIGKNSIAGAVSNAIANETAVGSSAHATGDQSLALGSATYAGGVSSTAIGANSQANYANDVALGAYAYAGHPGGIDLRRYCAGRQCACDWRGAASRSAMGANASFANSVALGAGSTTSVGALTNYNAYGLSGTFTSAGEVSVGSAGATRQITNVAPGSNPTDAVDVPTASGGRDRVGGRRAISLFPRQRRRHAERELRQRRRDRVECRGHRRRGDHASAANALAIWRPVMSVDGRQFWLRSAILTRFPAQARTRSGQRQHDRRRQAPLSSATTSESAAGLNGAIAFGDRRERRRRDADRERRHRRDDVWRFRRRDAGCGRHRIYRPRRANNAKSRTLRPVRSAP